MPYILSNGIWHTNRALSAEDIGIVHLLVLVLIALAALKDAALALKECSHAKCHLVPRER